MAKIEDCDYRLINAWNAAVIIFKERHPDLTPKIVCAYRSPQEQNELYKIGRTVKGANVSASLPMGRKVTNASALESPHNYDPSQAFDFFFIDQFKHGVWSPLSLFKEFAQLCLDADPTLVWGGSFQGLVDSDHIELKNWRELKPQTV